jgi:hypothetical protein
MGAFSILYMNILKANGTNTNWVVFHLRSFGFNFKRVVHHQLEKTQGIESYCNGCALVHERTRVRSSPLVSITFDGFSFHKLS